jgi:hypothetical protein
LPLPPPRLSTTTDWLVTLASESDRMRAEASTKPPGGLGTTSVIGLLG